jgi:hypothetical protein
VIALSDQVFGIGPLAGLLLALRFQLGLFFGSPLDLECDPFAMSHEFRRFG